MESLSKKYHFKKVNGLLLRLVRRLGKIIRISDLNIMGLMYGILMQYAKYIRGHFKI